ncbi:hypothetical protein V8C86DRAFT_69231 [Haematococcus lacustris]
MPCCVHLALALARMHCPHPQLTASLALTARQDPFSLQPWALAALIWSTTVQGACPPNWLKQLGPAVKEYVEDGRMHPRDHLMVLWCYAVAEARYTDLLEASVHQVRAAVSRSRDPGGAAASELPGGNTAASRREALQREVSVAKLRQLLLRPGSWAPGHVLACYARLGATLPPDLAATLRNLDARNRRCASRPLVPPWMSRVRGVPMMPPRGIGAV